jgi:hypothetical protein
MVLADPADITGERAEVVYQAIRRTMIRHYMVSGDPVAGAYQHWQRFNTVPYRSGPHGKLFVNNYANDMAAAYGRYEKVGTLPSGSMVAKDSFVVTESGQVMTGPFFLMEKRDPDFNAASNDWLFMMVSASGTVAGITNGKNSAAVEFCADCHSKAPREQDNLFLMPDDVRRRR